MSVQHYLRRFLRKFVFDVFPGALASVVGAMFFAQHWAQPAQAPVPRAANTEQVARQSEEVTRMVREEHSLMVEFLKREQQREAARQPLTISEMKARQAAAAATRRPVAEPVREAKSAPAAAAPAALPARTAAISPAPAKPAVAAVAVESGPPAAPESPATERLASDAPAPEPRRPGGLARVTAWALALADHAVDATGLRQIPAVVRAIKGGPETIGSEFQAVSDARLIDASR